MSSMHWMPPDIGGDILVEAMRSDVAEAVAIHVRPELHVLISRQSEVAPPRRPPGVASATWAGIRFVVDDQIPASPGYEIHRAPPPIPRRTPTHAPGHPNLTLAVAPAAGLRQRRLGSVRLRTGDRRPAVPLGLAG